jgi:hypothetical protein
LVVAMAAVTIAAMGMAAMMGESVLQKARLAV